MRISNETKWNQLKMNSKWIFNICRWKSIFLIFENSGIEITVGILPQLLRVESSLHLEENRISSFPSISRMIIICD